jgi:hypothetical protein
LEQPQGGGSVLLTLHAKYSPKVDGIAVSFWAMTFRVLLVTTMRWPFAARLAGAFAGQGAHVEALCPPGHVLGASRHVARLYPYHPLFPRLAEAMALSRPDLVVPCDDPAAQLLARFGQKA